MTKAIITEVDNIRFLFIYENDILVECHPLKDTRGAKVGDIYLGRVDKVLKNIQSAFIQLDEENIGYLPLDDSTAFITNRQLPKGLPSISQNDYVLVQVETESHKKKQAKVTGNINFCGNYVALDMTYGFVGVSKKIKDIARVEELKSLASNIKYGVIFRTACKEADNQDIVNELEQLSKQFDILIQNATYEKRIGLLSMGQPLFIACMEEYGLARFDRVITDLQDIYDILNKQTTISKCLEYYQEEYSLSKLYGLETHISHLKNNHIWLKSGGFLVIEPTEAMVVIDVNTGKSINKKNMDQHIFNTNVEAAKEIARQLRLRNLSGIIMIDFINMNDSNFKEQLINVIKSEIKKDKVQTHFIEVTKLDLYELTRKKIRKPFHEII